MQLLVQPRKKQCSLSLQFGLEVLALSLLFFARVMDNSGNGAMTGISTITATTGKGLLPEVNFHQPLRVAQAEAVLDSNGSISSINILMEGLQEEPEAYIMGGNSDAEVNIKIDQNNSSASYGQVIDINNQWRDWV